MTNQDYYEFIKRFALFSQQNKNLITITLSNIFTMRLVGNKTHGDLAEIAISEFINQYMYDFNSIHVGKDLYRAKSKEEDITVKNLINDKEFPISLKAYGDGPLQLSTDKDFRMYPLLQSKLGKGSDIISDKKILEDIFNSDEFTHFRTINILSLIYNEKKQQCNILVFDVNKALKNIEYIKKIEKGSGRKHPVFTFFDKDNNYICEVRYGNATANALQRGLWTNTKNALPYFESVTGGWIDYSHNKILVKLFSYALVASEQGHIKATNLVQEDIERLKQYKV